MKLQTHTRENEKNEETKRGGSHNHNGRETEEYNKYTLSDFSDCILIHILSLLNPKEAIQTCQLSTRWKHLWKKLPTFTFNSHDFKTLEGFTEFVNQFLSLRDSSTALNGLDIELWDRFHPPCLLERIVSYGASHNLNRLRLSYAVPHFPTSLFSCPSLTSLDLKFQSTLAIFPNTLNLRALTYLKLHNMSFCSGKDGRVEPFSTFNMLNTLILYSCKVWDAKPLCISNTTLLNLTIHSDPGYDYDCGGDSKIELSASNLCNFAFSGMPFLKFYGSSLSSIKQVSIHVYVVALNDANTPLNLLNWLMELVNIKSLTVSTNTLQVLSIVPDLMKVKPPSWYNLKSFKVELYQDQLYTSRWNVLAGGMSWKENAKLREAIKAQLKLYSYIPDGVIDFLLQNSPSAKVDILIPDPPMVTNICKK